MLIYIIDLPSVSYNNNIIIFAKIYSSSGCYAMLCYVMLPGTRQEFWALLLVCVV